MPAYGEVPPIRNLNGAALDMTITPHAPTSTQNGGLMKVSAQAATGSNNGGPLELRAGDSVSGIGGDVNIYSGAGSTAGQFYFTGGVGTSGGGQMNLVGGDATGSAGAGGSVFVQGGNAIAGGGSTGGDVYLFSGQGATSGGSVYLFTAKGATPGLQVTDDGTNTKVGLFGATPVVRPTTGGASATFVANSGTAVNSASTFDGYTIAQVVRALKVLGALT